MSNAMDGLVGALGTVIVGGILLKTTQTLFGQQKPYVKARKPKKMTARLPRLNHPGNFSNIGL